MRVKLVLTFALVAGCSGEGKTPAPFGVPITGGTLLVTRSGDHAIVADPDRDRIVSVDLRTSAIASELALTAGDEPGRVIEDAAGRIHVALRRGGAVVTLEHAAAKELAARRFACSEPRGLVYDEGSDAIHVACAGGELVTFPAAGGDATRTLRLDRDLRDVIVAGDEVTGRRLLVTRFRSAEVLTIDAAGAIVRRTSPPPVPRFGGHIPFLGDPSSPPELGEAFAAIAWRSVALPDGRVLMSHQRQTAPFLDASSDGGYGGNCGNGPVESGVTVFDPRTPDLAPFPIGAIARGALPVDLAVSRQGDRLALVLAGKQTVTVRSTAEALVNPDREECGPDDDGGGDDNDGEVAPHLGAPTSAAFAANGDLVIFYPERASLVIRAASGAKRLVELTGEHTADPGRGIFHRQTALKVACASCHPEGREDGLTWFFAQFGSRRTQSLAGNLLERAPFHWSGDMGSLSILMDDVFASRMSGGPVSANEKAALATWIDRIPAPAPFTPADATAVARGKQLFESDDTACASCHNGDLFTNNQLVDVGTGGLFKVPSLLGVGSRAPFMHDGCAGTLTDRFVVCGNSNLHGRTAHLTPAQIADLVAYLESI